MNFEARVGFKLVDGEPLMATKPFKALHEFGGESVARAVAQLFALVADVIVKTTQESR